MLPEREANPIGKKVLDVKIAPGMGHIVNMASTSYVAHGQYYRKMILKLLLNVRFLAKPGLPYSGTWHGNTTTDFSSNSQLVMQLRGGDMFSLEKAICLVQK